MVSIVGQNGNVETMATPIQTKWTHKMYTLGQTQEDYLKGYVDKGALDEGSKKYISKVEQFRTLMDAAQPKSQLMVEYARDILDNFTRCQTRQTEIEKGIVDLVQMKTEIWDINEETGLIAFIAEQDVESDLYYTK